MARTHLAFCVFSLVFLFANYIGECHSSGEGDSYVPYHRDNSTAEETATQKTTDAKGTESGGTNTTGGGKNGTDTTGGETGTDTTGGGKTDSGTTGGETGTDTTGGGKTDSGTTGGETGTDTTGGGKTDSDTTGGETGTDTTGGGKTDSGTTGGGKTDSGTTGGGKNGTDTTGGETGTDTTGGGKTDSDTTGGGKTDSDTTGGGKTDTEATGGETTDSGSTKQSNDTTEKAVGFEIKVYRYCWKDDTDQEICERRCSHEKIQCRNGGYCLMDDNDFPYCKCESSKHKVYSGAQCELETEINPEQYISNCNCYNDTFVLVTVFTSLVILLLFASNLFTYYMFKNREKKRAASMHKFTFVRNGQNQSMKGNETGDAARPNTYTQQPFSTVDERKASADSTYNTSALYFESKDFDMQDSIEEDPPLAPPVVHCDGEEVTAYQIPISTEDLDDVYDTPKGKENITPSAPDNRRSSRRSSEMYVTMASIN